jgi:hypothetical protein
MPAKKIIEDAERSGGEDDAQPLNDSFDRLPECRRPSHRSEHNENHWGKREEHVEGDRLRQRDAARNDTKQSAVESVQER